MRGASIVSGLEGIQEAAFMMATSANRKLVANARSKAGIQDSSETLKLLEGAHSNDLIISIIASEEGAAKAALEEAKENILKGSKASGSSSGGYEVTYHSIGGAIEGKVLSSDPNWVFISAPGQYAAAEAMKALGNNINVFMFSDNVDIEDEKFLKTKAVEKDLFVMGPDCGTAAIDGVPFGFANVLQKGRVGLVGASGTGLQEVSCLLEHIGVGVTQVIGVGGRDLDEKVGGLMMIQGIKKLLNDPQTTAIVLVSKPPSKTVANKIFELIKDQPKPFVVNFLTAEPEPIEALGLAAATTLEEAALMGGALARDIDPKEGYQHLIDEYPALPSQTPSQLKSMLSSKQTKIQGLFSGGTMMKEAKYLFHQFDVPGEHTMIDLGDDEYTQGRPHPMIDYSLRNQYIVEAGKDPETGVVLLDVVLGYGSHDNPAGELVPAIKKAKAAAKKDGRELHIIASVCGTEGDPQTRSTQIKALNEAGVILQPTNAQACRYAASVFSSKEVKPRSFTIPDATRKKAQAQSPDSSDGPGLFDKIRALNIGLESFSLPVGSHGGECHHLSWKPPAGGDVEVGKILAMLSDPTSSIGKKIDKANAQALDRYKKAHPYLVDVQPAAAVIPGMTERTILHSGPPISWEKMCGPQQGAIIGAILYEGWAKTPEAARELADSGSITFSPCHQHSTVGPMAGIVCPSMPVQVIENTTHGNRAFASMNEGLGKVLRFGAYNEEVLDRLKWMGEVLGPNLSKALKSHGPVDCRSILIQALQMGDECHNRSSAASLLFIKEMAPSIVTSIGKTDLDAASSTLGFVLNNGHFFLNLSMASVKSALDAAHGIEGSTMATVMCRNGVDFGIRLSGTHDDWFTTAAPPVKGLYFPGYSEADANPDMGDSSITETGGIGGFSMAAAPAIVGFVGGTGNDALNYTREMYRITMGSHPEFKIPSLDFAGSPIGIDARKVLDVGINPIINTGIAHKEAGVGQIGAGICRAPYSVFADALVALAKKNGVSWGL